MRCRIAAAFLLLLGASAFAADDAKLPVDLVLLNAKIWTGDAQRPEAEALAAFQGRILFVGSSAEAQARFKAARVIDAQGRRALPGFHDSHVHVLGAGLGLARVQLKDAKDEAEFGRRLREFDAKLPKDRWLLGGDWDHDRTFAGVLPTARLVDKYVKERPVFLRRYDGHQALANTKALKLAGIAAATPDPSGGEIVRLANSKEPSGVLRDNAMGLMNARGLIPETDPQELIEAVAAALDVARREGVTSMEDMAGGDNRLLFRRYQQLAAAGKLTSRIGLRWPLAERRQLSELGVQAEFGSPYLRIGGLKGYIDGSLGSSTAKMFQPYLHEQTAGVYVTQPSVMKELVQEAQAAGLSVCVHAIGDQGNAVMLDIFAETPASVVPGATRRIEHAQITRREDYPRFKQLGVFASMQPYHIIDDGRWAEGRIGKERCAASYACRSLLDAGATLAFGSDWPVAPLSPILGIDAAVNRRTLDGKNQKGWFPEQAITVEEAVRAYTLGSAQAAGREKDLGTLTVGKLCDCVILNDDIFDPQVKERLQSVRVQTTILGGRVVFEGK